MHEDDQDPFERYTVVINDEEQYSIRPTEKTIPSGWRTVGKDGPKKECLDYIEQVWTDMRPLSLRKKMEEWAKNPPAPPAVEKTEPDLPPLVERLSTDQPIIFNCRPERTAKAMQERINMGYIHLKFTQTRGGTELGVQLDPAASDWTGANFENGTGRVRLVGSLTLDYGKVRCVATIDLSTLEGTGHLERVASKGSAVTDN